MEMRKADTFVVTVSEVVKDENPGWKFPIRLSNQHQSGD
jgi:hypothetical protein